MSIETLQRSLVLGIALLVGTSWPRCAGATNARDTEQSCRSFVEQFYNLYDPIDPERPLDATELSDDREDRQIDPDLSKRLSEVFEAEAKSGQILLDFDPVINGRRPAAKYAAGSVTRKGEHYLVEVYGVSDDGRKHDNPDVIAELVFQIGEWTFVNFHYPNRADTPENENLLSMLKRIRKSLRKENHSQPAGGPEGAPR